MNRTATALTSLIIMVASAGGAFAASPTKSVATSATGRPANGSVSAGPAARAWIKAREVVRTKKTKGKIVEVKYPQFAGSNSLVVNQLNAKIKTFVNSNFENGPANDDQPGVDHYEYSCSYILNACTPDLVSGTFNFYTFTGGAHGANTLAAFNYQLTKEGVREITLHSLFGKAPDVKALRDLVRPKLEKVLYPDGEVDEDWKLAIKDGTEKLSYLDVFTINSKGITITFQQYQVACYAAGQPAVDLSFAELRPLISKTSPVYKYVVASK